MKLSGISLKELNMQSHPSWVCGLKPVAETRTCIQNKVTPFVGVWIETHERLFGEHRKTVTPFVGVWIETSMININEQVNQVTPFVGVWIETSRCGQYQRAQNGHTLRGCVD